MNRYLLIESIDEVTQLDNEVKKVLSFLENKVEKYTLKSSEYLVGIIGGVF